MTHKKTNILNYSDHLSCECCDYNCNYKLSSCNYITGVLNTKS